MICAALHRVNAKNHRRESEIGSHRRSGALSPVRVDLLDCIQRRVTARWGNWGAGATEGGEGSDIPICARRRWRHQLHPSSVRLHLRSGVGVSTSAPSGGDVLFSSSSLASKGQPAGSAGCCFSEVDVEGGQDCAEKSRAKSHVSCKQLPVQCYRFHPDSRVDFGEGQPPAEKAEFTVRSERAQVATVASAIRCGFSLAAAKGANCTRIQ